MEQTYSMELSCYYLIIITMKLPKKSNESPQMVCPVFALFLPHACITREMPRNAEESCDFQQKIQNEHVAIQDRSKNSDTL